MEIFLSTLLFVGIVILVYMTSLYILSLITKRTDLVDIGWGLGFIVVTTSLLLRSTILTNRMLIVLILVTIWGLRLAIHIGSRNLRKKEDFRYQKFKDDWGKDFWWKSYIQIFLLQGLLMFLISFPMSYLGTYDSPLSWISYLGIFVWIFGFVFETVSDIQLNNFIKLKKSGLTKDRIMKTGLWSISRHPNYFGEVITWWGIFLISLSSLSSLIAILGPITITYFILKVTGVPLLEKKYDGIPEWEEYKKRVPIFIPLKLK